MKKKLLVTALFLLAFSTAAHADTYQIDAEHTAVTFKIRHLISYTQGSFNEFSGSFDYDPAKPEASKVTATVKAASIDTNVEPRDKHLRSADFFDVEKFPTLEFKSTKFESISPEKAKLEGLLTIHGVEKPVVFDVDVHGVAKDAWGNVRSAFTATTEINRKDFGLSWNKAVETGGVMVGEEVKITLEVEGIKQ